MSASPIADLSYRPYDGPLKMRAARWWYIAVARMRYLRSKWWFWVLAALNLFPWLIVALIIYLASLTKTAGPGGPNLFGQEVVGQKYAQYFYYAMGWQGFWLFFIALAAGAGSIAADNRANALLVYLSKPITKTDYLLGKWMGIFLTVFLTSLIPAVLFYLYCLMNYSSDGFLKHEPWLLLRVVGAALIPAVIHASLLVGFSAWSRTPLFAGVAYAGVYFFGDIAAKILWVAIYHGHPDRGLVVQKASVSGVINALQQWALSVTLHMTVFRRRLGEVVQITLPPPHPGIMLGAAVVLVIAGIVAARMRIRAVEVVRG